MILNKKLQTKFKLKGDADFTEPDYLFTERSKRIPESSTVAESIPWLNCGAGFSLFSLKNQEVEKMEYKLPAALLAYDDI